MYLESENFNGKDEKKTTKKKFHIYDTKDCVNFENLEKGMEKLNYQFFVGSNEVPEIILLFSNDIFSYQNY